MHSSSIKLVGAAYRKLTRYFSRYEFISRHILFPGHGKCCILRAYRIRNSDIYSYLQTRIDTILFRYRSDIRPIHDRNNNPYLHSGFHIETPKIVAMNHHNRIRTTDCNPAHNKEHCPN